MCIDGKCRCGNGPSCAGRITGSFCDSQTQIDFEKSRCKCSFDVESCPDGQICKNGICEGNYQYYLFAF